MIVILARGHYVQVNTLSHTFSCFNHCPLRFKFRELVEEGLRLALEAPRNTRRPPSLAELMEPARGVIDSGISDLASNPEHLAGFGRNVRHR
jgi:hypothetical protein